MQIFNTNEINIEAKENESPTLQIQSPSRVVMSCGCTKVELPNDVYTITIEPLPLVKYMVATNEQTSYVKTVYVTINDKRFTINIKVSKN